MLDRKMAREELEKTSQGLIYSTLTDSLEIVKNKMVAENKHIADIASPEINVENGLLPQLNKYSNLASKSNRKVRNNALSPENG